MALSDTTPAAPPKNPPYHTLAVAALVVGAILLVLSVCAVIAFLALPLYQAQNALTSNTAVFSLGALFVGYGAILVLFATGILRNRFTAPFTLPSPLIFIGAFLVVVILGQGVLSLNFAEAYLFPVWHVLASLLIPLAVLSFGARRLAPVSQRTVLAQFAWGGLVTILGALLLEMVLGALLVILGVVAVVLVLGVNRFEELQAALSNVAVNQEPLLRLLMQQPLTLVITLFLAFVGFVILVPLVEELLKAAGPAILISRRERAKHSPSRSQVLLWGLAAGAGYAFTENMLNTQGALGNTDGVISNWATTMLLRVGTSFMHIIATGTVAMAWYYAIVLKRPSRFFLFLGAAVAVHGVWNTSALLLGLSSTLISLDPSLGILGSVISVMSLLILLVLFGGLFFWLRALIRWAQPPPVEILPSQPVSPAGIPNTKEF